MSREEAAAKSNELQRAKYGDGYAKEMSRRSRLRKKKRGGPQPGQYKDVSAEMRRRAKLRWRK